LIATLLLLGWTGRANATCGDYLHVGGAAMADAHSSDAPLEAPKPCRGPGCRNGNPHGPLAPTAPIELSRITDQLLDVAMVRSPRRDDVRLVVIDVAASRDEGHLLEVNRPPESV
jgi:hypothetical protein